MRVTAIKSPWLAAMLLFVATTASADINYQVIQGRVCGTAYGCDKAGHCFYLVRVIMQKNGVPSSPATVKCDPSVPSVVSVCQQPLHNGACVAFAGEAQAIPLTCTGMTILNATSVAAYPTLPDYECETPTQPILPCL